MTRAIFSPTYLFPLVSQTREAGRALGEVHLTGKGDAASRNTEVMAQVGSSSTKGTPLSHIPMCWMFLPVIKAIRAITHTGHGVYALSNTTPEEARGCPSWEFEPMGARTDGELRCMLV